ncbi:MAG: WD40 repeat domain-containing protein [Bryobacteraceae bacterium]
MRALASLAFASAAMAQSLPGDRVLGSDTTVARVSYLDDGSIAGYGQGRVRVWDAATGTLWRRMDPEAEPDSSPVAFSPRRGQLAKVTNTGVLEWWDLKTARVTRPVAGIPAAVRGLVISPDGQSLATAHVPRREGGMNTVRVRDASGRERFAVPSGLGGISVMCFSPDGSALAAGSYDADLRVWNARNGELVRLIDDLPVSMFALSFSPDGKHLAAAGVDRTVYLWDTGSWKIARKLTGQPEMISALAFSPDGRFLVTGGFNVLTSRHPVKVIVWEIRSGKMVRTMEAPHRVSSATFSPDGKRVAAAYGDKAVSVWQVRE